MQLIGNCNTLPSSKQSRLQQVQLPLPALQQHPEPPLLPDIPCGVSALPAPSAARSSSDRAPSSRIAPELAGRWHAVDARTGQCDTPAPEGAKVRWVHVRGVAEESVEGHKLVGVQVRGVTEVSVEGHKLVGVQVRGSQRS